MLSRLEPGAFALSLASPLALLALAPDGPALLSSFLLLAIPAALLYGLYRLALRGRPRPERRPLLVPPPVGPVPGEVRAAWFEVRRDGRVVVKGTFEDVVAAARAAALRPGDVVAGAGVELPADAFAELVPFVASAAELRLRRTYLGYLAVALAVAALGIAALAAARLGGRPPEGGAAIAVLFFALALLPLPFLRRLWRRLEDGRARGLVPEPLAVARRTLGSEVLDRAVAGAAPATRAVLAVVVAISALALLLPPEALLERLAKDNAAIRAGEPWRLLTAGLVHGSVLHLAMNAMVLNDLGRFVESLFGPRRFLVLLWVGVLGGSLASYATNPSPSVGISGGLFALVGAMLALGLRHRRRLPPPVRRMLLRGPVEVIVLNLALGLSLPIIDNAAHLGGLATGFLLALAIPARREVEGALDAGPGPGPVRPV